jgi:outer membrane receptor protein involved in Fe transport
MAGASVLAAAAAAITATPAVAQDSEDDTIVVTGTRIRQPNLDGPVPVQTLSADVLDLSGSNNAYDVLRELPVSGIPGISSTNSVFSTQFAGINTVDLRNLGENRNLVLMNGRRFVGGVAGTNIVDFNMIPAELIDRVDVITGGASAVYGSDALAGVINVITRTDFEGVIVNLRGGITEREDFENFGASLTMGSNFADGRGNAVFNATWSVENGVYARHREDQGMGTDCFATGGPPGANVAGQFCPSFSSFPENTRFLVPNGPVSPVSRIYFPETDTAVPYVNSRDGFNRSAFRNLAVPLERFSFQTFVNYDVSPTMNVFVEAIYGRTESDSDQEPFPTGTTDYFATEAFCDTPTSDSDGDGNFTECFNGVSLANPLIPQALIDEFYARPGNAGRSLEESRIGFARRLVEVGPRGANAERETFRFLTGVRGDLNPDVRFEIALNYARTSDTQVGEGQIIAQNVRYALDVIDLDGNPATTDDIVCRDEAARAEGCVPLDIFNGAGSITPDMIEWIDGPSLRQAFNEQTYAIAFLEGEFGTGFFPADVAWVLGAESRNERARDVTDALTRTGQNAGNIADVTSGAFQVGEVFGELQVPLLRDISFAEDLTLNLSARSSIYERAGSEIDTQAYAASLEYEPIDGFRFRAQGARAVRAPNVGELFGPPGETFALVNDPCAGLTLSAGTPAFYNLRVDVANPANVPASGIDASTIGSDLAVNCYADPLIQQRVDLTGGLVLTQPEVQGVGGFVGGGSVDLFEETADTLTIGFVFQSPFDNPWLRNLTISADYYTIEIVDAIGSLGRQTSANLCYNADSFNPGSAFCANVVRFDSGPSIGAIDQVNSNLQNLGEINTEGVDYQAAWSLNFEDAGLLQGTFLRGGTVELTMNYSYLSDYSRIAFEGNPREDFTDTIGVPRDKGTIRFRYRQGPITWAWNAAYIGEVDIFGGNSGYNIPTTWFHSTQVRVNVTPDHEVFFGINNVFDEYEQVGGTNGDFGQTVGWTTFPDIYDGLGRRFSAGTRLRF